MKQRRSTDAFTQPGDEQREEALTGIKATSGSQRLMETVGGGLQTQHCGPLPHRKKQVATEHALVQARTEGRMRATPGKEQK